MLDFMGPYSYMAIIQRQREEDERKRRLEVMRAKDAMNTKANDVHTGGDNYGFLMPRRYNGESIDPEISRQARAQALIAFGIPLLKNAATGDWGGALAEGAAGFTGTMNDVLERYQDKKREEDQQNYERNRQEEDDARQAARDKAYMENLEADNKAREEKIKLEAERDANRMKYHQQLLNDVKDPEERKVLEPFVGTDQFDDKWFQLNKPKNEEAEIRLNLALASSARAADAASRAIDNMEYQRQRDRQQDVQRAQSEWDSEVSREAKVIADALKAERNAGVGRPDFNNPAAGIKPAPTAQEVLAIEQQAKALAQQKVTATRGPRPGGASAPSIPTPSASGQELNYDRTTGSFR